MAYSETKREQLNEQDQELLKGHREIEIFSKSFKNQILFLLEDLCGFQRTKVFSRLKNNLICLLHFLKIYNKQILRINKIMGSAPTTTAEQIQLEQQIILDLRTTIQSAIQRRRLKLSHQSNIYQKFQYLQENYQQYSPQFQELYATHNLLSTDSIHLIARMNISNLRVLILSHNDIVCESLRIFKDLPLRQLEYLYLDNNKIAHDGCFYLARTNFQSLLTINLDRNRINNEGCRNFAKANLPNLRTLSINQNIFGEKGLRYLSLGEWPLLGFAQINKNEFEPNKNLQQIKFRSEVKGFRLEIN